jgi:hypothetical protein
MKRIIFILPVLAMLVAPLIFSGCKKDKDTTPPVITLIGAATVYACVGSPYTDDGATAMDDTDGDISDLIVINNPVQTDATGTFTVTYNVTDSAGNKAEEVTRTVIVIQC